LMPGVSTEGRIIFKDGMSIKNLLDIIYR